MKVSEVIEKALRGELRWIDAADVLGVSDRQMRRWRRRYEHDRMGGLLDRRKGKPPKNKVPLEVSAEVLRLYRDTYAGFNVKHFWELLQEEHEIEVSYSWTKDLLHGSGYVLRHPKRGRYRRRRERKPMRGMMLHLDGSTHRWFESEDGAMQDMLALLDDANGEIVGAVLVPQESTHSVLSLLYEAVRERGTFGALYTDRASHFVYTPRAGEPPDRTKKTQVERVLDDLGIELICAYSPQARGRSERLWRTLQGRLPQELARAGVRTFEAANAFLQTKYLARFNRHFVQAPVVADETAFLPATGVDLSAIFTLRFERVVGTDHTVRFQNRLLQLPKTSPHATLAKRRVEVRVTLDGRLDIYLGTRRLQSFHDLVDFDDVALEAA